MTKRKIILFFIVLAIMLLVKYASGQDSPESVGWEPVQVHREDAFVYGAAAVVWGTFFGVVSGVARVIGRQSAARNGSYFTGDLVSLGL
ncbi:MAG: hypothetical protein JWO13_308 [Acidobacteriales bacterium]|nr:hypothetical protein [Terriglobales bacterium]